MAIQFPPSPTLGELFVDLNGETWECLNATQPDVEWAKHAKKIEWGSLDGDIQNQTDLQTQFDTKEDWLDNPGGNGYLLSSAADGTRSWVPGSAGGVPAWGDITGAIVDQVDLQAELDAKANQTALDTTDIQVSTNTIDIGTNTTNIGTKENALGDPTVDDMVLSSKIDGTRAWIEAASGGGGGGGPSEDVMFPVNRKLFCAREATASSQFIVPANTTTVRIVAIGGGGKALSSATSVYAAQGGAYAEGIYAVTPGEVLSTRVAPSTAPTTSTSAVRTTWTSVTSDLAGELLRAEGGMSATTSFQDSAVATGGTLFNSAGGRSGTYANPGGCSPGSWLGTGVAASGRDGGAPPFPIGPKDSTPWFDIHDLTVPTAHPQMPLEGEHVPIQYDGVPGVFNSNTLQHGGFMAGGCASSNSGVGAGGGSGVVVGAGYGYNGPGMIIIYW